MSGDGLGIVLGGAILIGAIPVIISGAAVIGAAYGGLKLAGFLARKGIDAHHRTHPQTAGGGRYPLPCGPGKRTGSRGCLYQTDCASGAGHQRL